METPPEQVERAPVAVVLLNFDGGEKLDRCIRSLAAQELRPVLVVFVDNGSAVYDETAVRRAFGAGYEALLRFERLETNVGYSKGMNEGIRRVLSSPGAPDWVMTLSNDAELEPVFFARFQHVVEALVNDERLEPVGMLAPKLRAMDDRARLDGAGLALSLDGMSTARGQREIDHGQYDALGDAFCPNGVAAIYRSELLREVGLLDEDFWAYCEDTDLGLRAWLAGWDCRFLPECVAYHARSSTLGEHSLKKLYLVERNHYWVALKNLPLPLLALNPALSSYRYLMQLYALLSRTGRLGRGFGENHTPLELAGATLKGLFDAGRGAPGALRKRLATRALRRRRLLEQLWVLWRGRLPVSELIFGDGGSGGSEPPS